MCRRFVTVFALTAAAAFFAAPAWAITCYTLLDANDSVLYRGYETPVNLVSPPPTGAADAAMRQKKQFLTISYVDDCLLVASASETGNYGPATVEEIVGGMRQFGTTGGATSPTGVPMGARAAASASPQAAPTLRSGSTSQRGGY